MSELLSIKTDKNGNFVIKIAPEMVAPCSEFFEEQLSLLAHSMTPAGYTPCDGCSEEPHPESGAPADEHPAAPDQNERYLDDDGGQLPDDFSFEDEFPTGEFPPVDPLTDAEEAELFSGPARTSKRAKRAQE